MMYEYSESCGEIGGQWNLRRPDGSDVFLNEVWIDSD